MRKLSSTMGLRLAGERERACEVGRRLRGGYGCPWDLCLRRCFCGWRGPAGGPWLASLVLVVPGLWLRGYASGYVKKNAELATTGPYAHTRNPLYLGSMLIAFGFAAAAASWVILAALAGLFAAIYIPTILGEEAYLREHFAGFRRLCARRCPRLLPRLTAARSSGGRGAGQLFAGALPQTPRVQCSDGGWRDLCWRWS